MNSSGIKRGAAFFAATAVAVAGIPALATTASAVEIDTQVTNAVGADDVQLYNIDFVAISPKNDGTDTTVRLQAGGGNIVEFVRFEYRLEGSPDWQFIDQVARNDDGSFFVEWDPNAAPFNLSPGEDNIDIRAEGRNGAFIPLDTDQTDDVDLFGNGPTVNTINVTADTDRGFYDATSGPCNNGDANVIVNGTSSVTSTAAAQEPFISWMDGSGAVRDQEQADAVAVAAPGVGTTFSGVIDLDGYLFDIIFPEEPDQLVVRAVTDATDEDTEDFETYTLYEQTITTVNAVNTGGNVLPDPANITVTVLDQNGSPIGNASVYRGSDNAFLGLTNGLGQVYTNQVPTQANPTDFYYADQECNASFSPGAGDKRSATVVADLAGSITITSNPAGTIPVGGSVTETATVRNNAGQPVPNTVVRIQRNGPGAVQDVQFLTTNAAGQVTYTFTCAVAGSVNVRAAFDDPSSGPVVVPPGDVIYDRFVDDKVTCGTPPSVKQRINPAIKGKNVNGGNDWVLVRAKAANGATVKIFKITGKNVRSLVATGKLNANGVYKKVFADNNGTDLTTYKAVVSATSDTQRGVTNRLQQPKIK